MLDFFYIKNFTFDSNVMKFSYSQIFSTMGALVLLVFSCKKAEKISRVKIDGELQNKYAEILQIEKHQINNIKLYSFIDKWYGVKYSYGGLSRGGVDCSGFCSILYKEVYQKVIDRSTQDLVSNNQMKVIGKEELTEGNLVFFNIREKKDAHVGVYLSNQKFVHASTSNGVIISSLDNPYYKQNFSKGGVFP